MLFTDSWFTRIRNDNYYEEKYKFLNNNNIKLFYTHDDKNLEVRNGKEIWVALNVILEMNITEKENKELSKKEIIGNTFGLKGYEKNNVIYIPEITRRILANKENYDLSSRKNYDRLNLCRIIEILEDSIEYNNSKRKEHKMTKFKSILIIGLAVLTLTTSVFRILDRLWSNNTICKRK